MKEKAATFKPRAPIVVVMGHVDHGKTTLLDYIRKSNVATKEAGGITQSIGAYEIAHNGRTVTFIDTPGHEAFTHMRARGATVADLAVLIIAAEEGVKPQTKEAISILQETKTPFVVAINKIDRPEANIEKIKQDLAGAGVLLEGYGGQVSFQPISAKTGQGVEELLDLILLTADLEPPLYDPEADATGFILESRIDQRRGLEATAIITNGTLRYGSLIATPTARGKVKILENFAGKAAKELSPSSPALIMGFETLPKNGETFTVGAGLPMPKGERVLPKPAQGANQTKPGAKDSSLKLILKASDAGCLEAFSIVMKNLTVPRTLVILDESIGDVSDGDVKMATASGATILGFRVRINPAARSLAEAQSVTIITSEIIYELAKTIEEFLAKPLESAGSGELEVLAVFNQKKLEKQVVGGKVVLGTMRNKAAFEIRRGDETLGNGRITGLEQQKKETNSVAEGNECGLLINASVAIQAGDRLVIKK